MDFSNYKFRPSKLKDLMVENRETITPLQLKKLHQLAEKTNLTEKQEKELGRLIEKQGLGFDLSETTKQALLEIYICEVYGREKEVSNKYTEKGTLVEEDSIDLLSEVTSSLHVKNKKTFENDYIKGTPDIVAKDAIIDIKSSWDIFTFAKSKKTYKEYYWQMMGYMWLTGKDIATLAFCLVNAPEHLIVQEKSRQTFIAGLMPEDDGYLELEDQIDKNMRFDDIPKIKRLKLYQIPYSGYSIEKLTERINQCRIYLQTIDL